MVHFNVGSRHVLAPRGRSPIIVDVPKRLSSLPGLNNDASFHTWHMPRWRGARMTRGWAPRMPNVHMPELSMPAMGMPKASMPDFHMPRLHIPATAIGKPRMTDIRMPELHMPGKGMRKGWGAMSLMGSRRRSTPRSMPLLLAGMMLGAAVMYFADPEKGNRRRKMAIDRGGALIRRGFRILDRRRRRIASDVYGARQTVMHTDLFENGRRKIEEVRVRTPMGADRA